MIQSCICAASSPICYLRTKVQAPKLIPKPKLQELEGNLKWLKFALKEGRWGQMLGKWEMTFKENTWWGRTGVGLAQTVGTQLKIHLYNCTNMKTQRQCYIGFQLLWYCWHEQRKWKIIQIWKSSQWNRSTGVILMLKRSFYCVLRQLKSLGSMKNDKGRKMLSRDSERFSFRRLLHSHNIGEPEPGVYEIWRNWLTKIIWNVSLKLYQLPRNW